MPEEKELCPTCSNSRWCEVWAEWKCTRHKKRMYDENERKTCPYYQKRSKGAKAAQCHCEDCLKMGREEEE